MRAAAEINRKLRALLVDGTGKTTQELAASIGGISYNALGKLIRDSPWPEFVNCRIGKKGRCGWQLVQVRWVKVE